MTAINPEVAKEITKMTEDFIKKSKLKKRPKWKVPLKRKK